MQCLLYYKLTLLRLEYRKFVSLWRRLPSLRIRNIYSCNRQTVALFQFTYINLCIIQAQGEFLACVHSSLISSIYMFFNKVLHLVLYLQCSSSKKNIYLSDMHFDMLIEQTTVRYGSKCISAILITQLYSEMTSSRLQFSIKFCDIYFTNVPN